ncbi:hypothetical protein RFI_26990, partial [Reticulomyxa filosa]
PPPLLYSQSTDIQRNVEWQEWSKGVTDMIESKKYGDVEFICELSGGKDESQDGKKTQQQQEVRWKAHKDILSKYSDVFAEMFEQKQESLSDDEVIVKDLKHPLTMKYVLLYIYTGIIPREELKQNNELCEDMLQCADIYHIYKLTALLFRFMKEDVNTSNVGVALLACKRYKNAQFCKDVVDDLKKTTSIFLRKPQNLKEFLKTPYCFTLFTSHPDLIQEVMMTWVNEEEQQPSHPVTGPVIETKSSVHKDRVEEKEEKSTT